MSVNLAGANITATFSAAGAHFDAHGSDTNSGGLDQLATLKMQTTAANVVVDELDDAINDDGSRKRKLQEVGNNRAGEGRSVMSLALKLFERSDKNYIHVNNGATNVTQRFESIHEAVKYLRPELPLFCVFPNELIKSANAFLTGFPGRVFYAVKANPDPLVLTTLHSAGVRNFDVASVHEIKHIRNLFPAANVAFMNPVKSRQAIRVAYFDHGVRTFALDCIEELTKIARETDNARDLTLIVRLRMPKGSALHPLIDKFGVRPDEAAALILATKKLALRTGLSFHVGSQTMDPSSYTHAIRSCRAVIAKAGIRLDILDVGGGFPIPSLGEGVPPLKRFFDVIGDEIRELDLGPDCEIWCEPGFALSGESTVLVLRVNLRKNDALYVNDGGYGALFDHCWLKRKNEVSLIPANARRGRKERREAFSLFGPTCDSADRIEGPFALPEDVEEGDWIAMHDMGAYAQTMQTGFNGFYSDQKVIIDPSVARKIPRRHEDAGRRLSPWRDEVGAHNIRVLPTIAEAHAI